MFQIVQTFRRSGNKVMCTPDIVDLHGTFTREKAQALCDEYNAHEVRAYFNKLGCLFEVVEAYR